MFHTKNKINQLRAPLFTILHFTLFQTVKITVVNIKGLFLYVYVFHVYFIRLLLKVLYKNIFLAAQSNKNRS